MKKRMVIMISALIVVFGGILLFHLVKSLLIQRFFATFEPPPSVVSSVTATAIDWEPRLNTVGNFVAISGVEVNSQASGNVVKIHFESGQLVDNNAPLIDIDDSIDQASLKFAEADRDLKNISYKRQTDLLKKGATSDSNVDEAKANLQQAKANVEKIEAGIKHKHITAPFAGKLGIRQVNLGEYVTPGQTSIVTLQSLDPLYLEFNLPEHLFKALQVKQGIEFYVDAFPGLLFKGEVTAINAKVDPKSHNILVQATVPNCLPEFLPKTQKNELTASGSNKKVYTEPTIVTCNSKDNAKSPRHNYLFLPGMFAAIAIEQPSIANVVVLPSTAISYSLYGDTVFKIVPTKERKKDAKGREIFQVKRVFIVKGEQEGNKTVILKGIKAGDVVVSSGEVKLQNGSKVVINNDILLNDNTLPENLSE